MKNHWIIKKKNTAKQHQNKNNHGSKNDKETPEGSGSNAEKLQRSVHRDLTIEQ